MLCLTECTVRSKSYTFRSSLTASFVAWSCNAHSGSDRNTFISALSVLTLRPLRAVQFSHPYSSVGAAFVWRSFNGASLFRVCSAHRLISYTHVQTFVAYLIRHYMRWTAWRVLKLLYLFSCVVVNNHVFCNLLTSFKYNAFRINSINSKVVFVTNFV